MSPAMRIAPFACKFTIALVHGACGEHVFIGRLQLLARLRWGRLSGEVMPDERPGRGTMNGCTDGAVAAALAIPLATAGDGAEHTA